MNLFHDIETVPSQKTNAFEEVLKNIKPPSTITKPESIEKWYSEKADEAAMNEYRKQSFDGLYGEIISIAWAINDEEPSCIIRKKGDSEKELLEAFFQWLHTRLNIDLGRPDVISKWVGHFTLNFDLRFLWQRCVINQVKPSVRIPYDAKPWGDDVFDTKIAWSGSNQYSGKSSLDAICKGFGFEGKGDLDGSKVYDYWLDGRYEEIAEYNKQDVEMCRSLYKQMNFIM